MADFDFQGALKAGYSNDEILRYLASQGTQADRLAQFKQQIMDARARNVRLDTGGGQPSTAAPREAMGPPAAPGEINVNNFRPWQEPETPPARQAPPAQFQPDLKSGALSMVNPEAGIENIIGGAQQMWAPSGTTADDPAFWAPKAEGAARALRGAGTFATLATPLGFPAAVEAPIPAIAGLTGGLGASELTGRAAEAAGVPQGQAELVSNLAGIAGGGLAHQSLADIIATRQANRQAFIDRVKAATGQEPPQEPLYQTLQAQADAALERIRQRGSLTGAQLNANPIPDAKDMAIWGASKIGQGIVDPVALRRAIVEQFGKLPRELVKQVGERARVLAIRNVREYRLGTSLDDIHPLTSETIPLSPEVEPSLSKKKTRLYAGHEQGDNENRIWTPERQAAEGPLIEAGTPSQLSYIDVEPEEVPNTGNKGRKLMVYNPGQSPERATGLLTEDVQRYLQDTVRRRLGAIPDDAPDHVKMRRLLTYGRKEFAEQLRQPYSGVDWYGPDTAESDRLLRQVRPELSDPDFDTIQKAISAAMSNNSNPQAEALHGSRIWEQAFDNWKRNPGSTLQFPEFQPDGKTGWPAQGAIYQIQKLNQMLKELGVAGTAEFLRDPQVTGRDIKHFVPNAKEIQLDNTFPGSKVLGPKIGQYFNQIMNIPSPSVVDVWMMRRNGRLLGNLFDANGNEIDAPRTEGERALSQDMDSRLARQHGLATRDAQSVGWHYEQELYRRLGLGVKSYRRSQGIQQYLESLGLGLK